MTIDDEIAAFIARTESFYPADAIALSLAEQRRRYDRLCAAFRQPRPEGLEVQDAALPSAEGAIPVRRYRPADARAAAVVYYHGGGFVVGGLESHDDVCAEIAATTRLEVIAVDYRLAPEHPYPACFDDALAASRALAAEGRPLVLAGDSAGGNLAAAVCLAARGDPRPPSGQVLIYPALGGDALGLASYTEQAEAPLLTARDCAIYMELRAGGPPPQNDPYFAPLACQDLAGAPPCIAFAAEADPLRDDAVEYVRRLSAAGVEARSQIEAGLVHSYLRARTTSRRAAESFAAICAAILWLSGTTGA